MSTSQFFPPVESSDADGLLAIGGCLTTEWLLDAYRHGIFPWPADERTLAWWSPDPRAVIEFDAFHVPRSLARTIRRGEFEITADRDFAGVVAGCATAQARCRATWITPSMRSAYVRLHDQGFAHSVEAWREGQLVGGVYGVSLGGLFAAESMFYRAPDASKVALVKLVEHVRRCGYVLVDIQQLTPHTARFGAREISREEYLQRLAAAIELPVTWSDL